MMMAFADPRSAPEIIAVREHVKSWRFYDHFRSDADAPARKQQIGTHTPVLCDDGADLAAALQTIREIGDDQALQEAIDDAFPGAHVEILQSEGRFEVSMRQKGLLRPLKAFELSDGTLRYLLLIAALLTPRPPCVLILNEPDTSLHPDLVPALARLIAAAARKSQMIIATHNDVLIGSLEQEPDAQAIKLEKVLGETIVSGLNTLDPPRWGLARAIKSLFRFRCFVRTINKHEILFENFEGCRRPERKCIRLHQNMRGCDRVWQTVSRKFQFFRSGRRAIRFRAVEIDPIHASAPIRSFRSDRWEAKNARGTEGKTGTLWHGRPLSSRQ
jgi:hypothetical protein